MFLVFPSNLYLKKNPILVRGAVEMQRRIGGPALLQDHCEYVNSAAYLELSQLENPAR